MKEYKVKFYISGNLQEENVKAENEEEAFDKIEEKYFGSCAFEAEEIIKYKYIYYYHARMEENGNAFYKDGILKRVRPIDDVKELILVKDAVFEDALKSNPEIPHRFREKLLFVTLSLMM